MRITIRSSSVCGRLRALVLLALLAGHLGCQGVAAIRSPVRGSLVQRTEIRMDGLPGAADRAAREALAFEARLVACGGAPSADELLTLSALWLRVGEAPWNADAHRALRACRDAAVLASLAISAEGPSATLRGIELHNRAVERALRIGTAMRDAGWREAVTTAGLRPVAAADCLEPSLIDEIAIASDFTVIGLRQRFGSEGLGVPVVARRRGVRSGGRPGDSLLPADLCLAATATVRLTANFEGGAWRTSGAELVLHDPFAERTVRAGGVETPLAADRSTALAVQVSDSHGRLVELTGLLESRFRDGVEPGLYMLHPYERGKIPVVFVHGLLSSPLAWVQAINELRNDPDIGSRYQLWVYLYPTGRTILQSARDLRHSLIEAHRTLANSTEDRSLDRMVLVGHSMGGLLARAMAQDAGTSLWQAMLHTSPESMPVSQGTRRELEELLLFRPLPFVRRLVFISTPHRGSRLADEPFARMISRLVRPEIREEYIDELRRVVATDAAGPKVSRDAFTSISNLRPGSPLLLALDRLPISPSVAYHSIIPLIASEAGSSDGVVDYVSAHLDGARTEFVFSGSHFSQQAPPAVTELRRILLIHLQEP